LNHHSPVVQIDRAAICEDPIEIWPGIVADEPYYNAVLAVATQLFSVSAVVIHVLDANPQWFEHTTGANPLGEEFLNATLGMQSAGPDVGRTPTVMQGIAGESLFAAHAFPPEDRRIRFGVHAPLIGRDGALLGTLWLLDSRARPDFREKEKSLLADFVTTIVGKCEAARAFQYHDRLTGLPNRTRFVCDIRSSLKLADAAKRPIHAVIVDICSLPYIDHMVVALGLSKVERAIQLMAQRVSSVMPREVQLYKLGHARFGFLCSGDFESAQALAAGCVARFEEPITVDDVLPITVAAYAGLMLVEDEASASEVVGALFAVSARARQADENLLAYDKSLMQAQQRRFHIINSARGALLSDDQLRLVYQPRERLSDSVCVAAEALIRWNHPDLGEILPSEFIPTIERTSLMPLLTDWVIDHALRQLALWVKTVPTFRLSINISPSDLGRADFIAMLAGAMRRHAVNGRNIELEITESALAQDVSSARRMLERLAELGVTVAIDDFGSGYSNLSQLYNLPFNVLKIDQGLVRDVLTNQRADAIVECVVALAKRLGHRVVVEGVETAELRSEAVRWNCDEVQGYLISRPLEAGHMSAWLVEHAHH